MPDSLVVPLALCRDRSLVGGKAAGLGALLRQGFAVPAGICVTTRAYEAGLRALEITPQQLSRALRESEPDSRPAWLLDLSKRLAESSLPHALQQEVEDALSQIDAPSTRLWAVRSSATSEDGETQSLAGQFDTKLGVSREQVPEAIVHCWASLWRPHAVDSVLRGEASESAPAMAVIIQVLIAPVAAGVVFTSHPFNPGDQGMVINAVFGLGVPVVHGSVTPDEFVLRREGADQDWTITERRVAAKTESLRLGVDGLVVQSVPPPQQHVPTLSDPQLCALARLARDVEVACGSSMDIEWALDHSTFWLVQARRITTKRSPLTNEGCEWSRANFKETLPELPSPMGLSFLQEYMEHNLLRHYRRLGCCVPDGVTPVRVIQGRPFINVTLFQWFVCQLGSDPKMVTEHMGGEATVPVAMPARLPWYRLGLAAVRVWRMMRQAEREGPAWFREMKEMADVPVEQADADGALSRLLAEHERIGQRLRDCDPTFGIALGVSQGLSLLPKLLAFWFPTEGRAVLNGALQGRGTVISAKQILWLADLAARAATEPACRQFFTSTCWYPDEYRRSVSGTSFLLEWDQFMAAYGHRAIGESDVMTPRHAEAPASLLGAIRAYLLSGDLTSSCEVLAKQAMVRTEALGRIRARLRWWPAAWWLFHRWYDQLCRFLSLREDNRHHLMYLLLAIRRRMLVMGTILSRKQRLRDAADIFFLTVEEIRSLVREPERDWRMIVSTRQAAYQRHAEGAVPDSLSPKHPSAHALEVAGTAGGGLHGISISPGQARGPVCVVREVGDLGKVRRGVIMVVAVLDPGLSPYFGLAAGLVAEMGGTLSHGAIIAREYGIPAVANIAGATSRLTDGEVVELDASAGLVRPLARNTP